MHTPPNLIPLPNAESRLWRRWITRDRSSPCSLEYRRNSRRASSYFLSWFLRPNDDPGESYSEMLKKMQALIIGKMRRHPSGYDPQSRSPGIFRDVLMKQGDPLAVNGVVFFGAFQDLSSSVYEEPECEHRRGRNRLLRIHYDSTEFSSRVQVIKGRYRVHLEGLPAKCWPVVNLYSKNVLPIRDFKAFELAMAKAETLLDEIKAIDPASTRSSVRSRKRLLRKLANYYQLMLAVHPFNAQNNSLLMNQVNCILFVHELPIQYHSILDALSFMVPSRMFERLFERIVSPNLSRTELVAEKRLRVAA